MPEVSRAQFKTNVNANIADGANNSAADARGAWFESIDSSINRVDDATAAGLLVLTTPLAFRRVAVPANTGSTGTVGDIAFDTDYAYFCVATNTWRRAIIGTW